MHTATIANKSCKQTTIIMNNLTLETFSLPFSLFLLNRLQTVTQIQSFISINISKEFYSFLNCMTRYTLSKAYVFASEQQTTDDDDDNEPRFTHGMSNRNPNTCRTHTIIHVDCCYYANAMFLFHFASMFVSLLSTTKLSIIRFKHLFRAEMNNV